MPVIDSKTRRSFLTTLLPASLVAGPALAVTIEAHAQRTWQGRGEIREIDRERSSVTIRHEAIPGLMGAMTMPFRLARASLLDGRSVGERVAFTLGRVEGRLVIQSMRAL